MESLMKLLVSFLVWAYFKYLTFKESKKLKDKMDKIREDKDIKNAIKKGDVDEVAKIIKYYSEYGKVS